MIRGQLEQLFGNYRLLCQLGRGGFSQIYLAEHELFHTQAVVKILDGRRTENDIAKFLAQASVLIHLRHPHIVPVLDFGLQDDTAYLVMDYAPHGSLRERHPKGTSLSPEIVTLYINQVALALDYIHQHKLIHRDVKPQNLLLGPNNEVLLSDFGIAVVSQSLDPLYAEVYDFEGTVIYAAPEQLQGKPRRSSDQYALGIVVYEWLCGSWPFSGSFDELVHQHLFVPPVPLRAKNSALSPAIEYVVMKALAKDPDERFSSVGEFASALSHAVEGSPSVPTQTKARRQFRSPQPFRDLESL
ncbi:serine/threonine protein kinase [Ktedonosporobacter rubrisoli]|uniref:non-specific serine/threonine protein kinase n=1 Tax=Ktedonosporobacter rubrisoli TaxID=2509675 RepID=A0A4P6JRB7_KTERU|nr:serine/threonine-protein kinase [Ktedonosporobacter rubrisoli]QBD77833.1 serine/threonine protein kinase [Ktedonosporobacter rubrisoli]